MSNEYFKIDLAGYVPLEVILVKPDDFLKVRETLTRIGVAYVKIRFCINLAIFYTNKENTISFILKSSLP